ncbi:hypothetical protein DFP72DRAFT_862801 [Ephemerocybe angulata]|uniref:Uncharacterized protein n=1 Tax=Ephemerocybe angulata TaxID=980116 RepID=A0A8H6H8D2_9AGAR|nr:hypothetical protein DFP72DRAFT_862801 [Tulosesus angulatus]
MPVKRETTVHLTDPRSKWDTKVEAIPIRQDRHTVNTLLDSMSDYIGIALPVLALKSKGKGNTRVLASSIAQMLGVWPRGTGDASQMHPSRTSSRNLTNITVSEAPTVLGRDVIPNTESLSVRDLLETINTYARSPDRVQSFDGVKLEARRNHPIKMNRDARNDIHAMLLLGHTDKQYKAAKKWHRKQVQRYIDRKPNIRGGRAVIQRAAHAGGSNPDEKNHITAQFYKGGQQVETSFTDRRGRKVYTPTHHVYTKGSPQGATILRVR